MRIQVTVETPDGKLVYDAIVDDENDPPDEQRRIRNVVGASVQMGFALLDAKFKSETFQKEPG